MCLVYEGTWTRSRFILNRFSPAHYTHCIFVRVVNDEAFFLSSATFFSSSLLRSNDDDDEATTPESLISCNVQSSLKSTFCSLLHFCHAPYTSMYFMLSQRAFYFFFLFLLFLLHPHPPTIQLQNSFTLHIIMLLLLELASHTLLPLARDAKITCCCAFFLPEAFSWNKKNYQAFSRMCSKWGLSFLTNINYMSLREWHITGVGWMDVGAVQWK